MKSSDILNRGYLKKFLLLLLTIFIAGTAISAAVLYSDIYRPLNTHYGAIISIVEGIKESLIEKTLKINIISYVMISAGIGALSLLYSHRIAGPLYRIKLYLRSMSDGKQERKLKLRHKDAINSFALTINEMNEAYRNKSLILDSDIDELKKYINEVKKLAGQDKSFEDPMKRLVDTDKHIGSLLEAIRISEK